MLDRKGKVLSSSSSVNLCPSHSREEQSRDRASGFGYRIAPSNQALCSSPRSCASRTENSCGRWTAQHFGSREAPCWRSSGGCTGNPTRLFTISLVALVWLGSASTIFLDLMGG